MYQGATAVMAISKYVAGAVKRFYNKDSTVISPLVEREQYLVANRERKYITMVRGHHVKGADFFIDLAKRLPNHSFAIAGVCEPSVNQKMGQTPNITHFPQRRDMREVYSQTSIYLAPVVWAEPFGRTLVEAMINGIPVVGSNRGAVPEVLGEAGVVLPLETPEKWIETITRLLRDGDYYNTVSDRCYQRALAPKFDLDKQVNAFVNLAGSLVTPRATGYATTPISAPPAKPKAAPIANPQVAFFGPWIGEFGWEAMSWQSWCRKEAKKYKKVYACSFPGMELFYRDFAEFIPHRHAIRELWGPTPRPMDFTSVECDVPPDVDIRIEPIWSLSSGGDFIKFGDEPNDQFSCLIHARNIQTHGQGFKNYPIELWEELVQGLPADTAFVGTSDDIYVEGATDLRGIPLEELANYIAGCKVMVGGSSGPMHFSCLCGAPMVVWGPRLASNASLEERYKRVWNPFRTRVEYITSDDWKPDPVKVIALANRILETP